MAITLSAVRPYDRPCGPQALLPIMPPMVARLAVEGSGPNRKPCGASAFCKSLSTTPGCTTAVCCSTLISSTWFIYREKSSTNPGPTELPAHEDPPPRGSNGDEHSRATSTPTSCPHTRPHHREG